MRIIIPSDGSASCREAIRFIGERAKFMREKPVVELANVQYAIPESIIDRFGLEAVCAVYEAEGRAQLAECTKTAERAGLSVETLVLYGECGPSLAREAQVFRADLIAMGSRGLSPAKSFFLGSVSRSVLEHSSLPVLLVRKKGLPERENMRIALAADGSDYGEAAANFIAEHLDLFGPGLTVDVISIAPDYVSLAKNEIDGVSPASAKEFFEKESQSAWENAVSPVLATLTAAGIDARPVKREGDPAEAISAYANENADIVVMGSHGYGRFKSAVLGSTAARVGALSEIPVLVIRLPEDLQI